MFRGWNNLSIKCFLDETSVPSRAQSFEDVTDEGT